MNEEELLKEAEELIIDLKTTPVYQKYKILKKEIDNNSYLQSIKQERAETQHQIKYNICEEKKKLLEKAKELNDEYNNNPIVLNYQSAKEDLLNLLSPLLTAKL